LKSAVDIIDVFTTRALGNILRISVLFSRFAL